MPWLGMCRNIQRAKGLCFPLEPLISALSEGSSWGSSFLHSPAGRISSRMERLAEVSTAHLGKGCLDITFPQTALLHVQKCWKTAFLWSCCTLTQTETAAGAEHPRAWSRTACFLNWSTWQLRLILQRNPSANPATGDICPTLVSLRESRHVTMALSHCSGAGSSPDSHSAFGECGFTRQPAVTERG